MMESFAGKTSIEATATPAQKAMIIAGRKRLMADQRAFEQWARYGFQAVDQDDVDYAPFEVQT